MLAFLRVYVASGDIIWGPLRHRDHLDVSFVSGGLNLKVWYHGANNSIGNLVLKAYLNVPWYHLHSFACGICWSLGLYYVHVFIKLCIHFFSRSLSNNLWTSRLSRQQVSAIYCNQVIINTAKNRSKVDWCDPPQQTNRQRAHLMAIFWPVSAKLPWNKIILGDYFRDFWG